MEILLLSLVSLLLLAALIFVAFDAYKKIAEIEIKMRHLADESNRLAGQLIRQEHKTATAQNELASVRQQLSAQTKAKQLLSAEVDEAQAKLKSAYEHISVLRVEIVKLNRQLNQTKRRG